MVTKQDLMEFLKSELGVDTLDIDETTLLVSSGIIDSFSLVSLVTFLEKECSFRMSPGEVNLDNLDSIERILGFVSIATPQA